MTQHARRILMLCTDLQIDRRILLEADSLEEDGWQVTILAASSEKLSDNYPDDRRVVRLSGGQVSILRKEGLVLLVSRKLRHYLPANGLLMRFMRSFAWKFLVDQERFYLNLFLGDGLNHKADVVVAHDLPMLAVGRRLADEFGAKLVYDSHELYCEQEISLNQRKRWERVERRHIDTCDKVITVNPSIASELERRYGLARVEVILNADRIGPLAENSQYLRDYFGIPEDHYVLLLQGGFSEGRNLLELAEAFSLVQNEKVHLVFLGEGVLSAELASQASRSDRLHVHPAVPQKDLLSVTCSADAGVIPYLATCLNNYYCTPNKLFEFIAAGLPILGSDLPEIRRIVHGKDIGRVADFSSKEAIASAIDDFFSDVRRLRAWKTCSLSVREEICWQKEGELLKEIYRSL